MCVRLRRTVFLRCSPLTSSIRSSSYSSITGMLSTGPLIDCSPAELAATPLEHLDQRAILIGIDFRQQQAVFLDGPKQAEHDVSEIMVWTAPPYTP